MTEVKLISELFMIVLCILTGPFDNEDINAELLIDLIGNSGYVDTLIVKHADGGFIAFDEMNGKLAEVARIQPVEDKKYTYICTDIKGKKETVNLAQSIVDFKSMDIGKGKRDVLKIKGGQQIRRARAADIVYLTPVSQKHTYVVHQKPKD